MNVNSGSQAAPQAPHRGRAARLLGPLHVTGVFWYRIHRWAMRHLPEWAIRMSIPACVAVFYGLLRRIDRAIARNLDTVLGACGWLESQRRVVRTLHQYAWCLSERYERFNESDDEGRLDVEGLEFWRRLHADSKGFILLTAHVGHWELGSVGGSARSDRIVHLVREEELDPNAQKFVAGLISQEANDRYHVHFAQAGDPTLGFELLNVLRAGQVVALQGDRPRAGGASLPVPLCGRPYALPVGPAALARSAEVEILPVFVFREGRRHARCVFRPPVAVERTDDRDRDLKAALEEVASHIEWAIRERPYQWFCFREAWGGAEDSSSDDASPSA